MVERPREHSPEDKEAAASSKIDALAAFQRGLESDAANVDLLAAIEAMLAAATGPLPYGRRLPAAAQPLPARARARPFLGK